MQPKIPTMPLSFAVPAMTVEPWLREWIGASGTVPACQLRAYPARRASLRLDRRRRSPDRRTRPGEPVASGW